MLLHGMCVVRVYVWHVCGGVNVWHVCGRVYVWHVCMHDMCGINGTKESLAR